MKTIAFGQTGVEVSAMCLGVMEFGTRISTEDSYQVLDAYYENGGRFLDSANIYAHWLDGGSGGDQDALSRVCSPARGTARLVAILTPRVEALHTVVRDEDHGRPGLE